jgi:hypothetical protein
MDKENNKENVEYIFEVEVNETPLETQAWNELTKVSYKEYVKEKIGQKYIPWSDAYTLLMNWAPESSFRCWHELYQDGSAMAYCELNVVKDNKRFTKTMFLPVQVNNKSIKNPDSSIINKAYMRVLAKTIGLCGLGINIYRGEEFTETEKFQSISEDQIQELKDLVKEINGTEEKLLEKFEEESFESITLKKYEEIKTFIKQKIKFNNQKKGK